MAGEAATTEAEAPAKKKSRGPLLVLLMMVLIGSAAGGVVLLRRGSRTAEPKPAESPIKTVLPLESFVVNLAEPERHSFLRVGIALGTDRAAKKGEGAEANSTPVVRDAILAVLTTARADDLLTPEGKQKLKTALLESVQQRVPQLQVREIYFTEFLVQQ